MRRGEAIGRSRPFILQAFLFQLPYRNDSRILGKLGDVARQGLHFLLVAFRAQEGFRIVEVDIRFLQGVSGILRGPHGAGNGYRVTSLQ